MAKPHPLWVKYEKEFKRARTNGRGRQMHRLHGPFRPLTEIERTALLANLEQDPEVQEPVEIVEQTQTQAPFVKKSPRDAMALLAALAMMGLDIKNKGE